MATPTRSTAQSRRGEQAARQRLDARRRRTILFTAIAVVLAVVAVLVVVATTSSSPSSSTKPGRTLPAAAPLLAKVTGVPASTLDAIGVGTAVAVPKKVNDTALQADGKPLVLYIGADYCPFCAGERWALIQALSRFGTWSGLHTSTSAADDVHPNTPTFSFHGATYTSNYLAFAGRELYTNKRAGSYYQKLDPITPSESQLLDRYGSGFPFIDFAGAYVQPGISFDPAVLDGKSWDDIANSLASADSSIARGIDGSANVLTAALCRLSGDQPAAVCTAPAVRTAQRGYAR